MVFVHMYFFLYMWCTIIKSEKVDIYLAEIKYIIWWRYYLFYKINNIGKKTHYIWNPSNYNINTYTKLKTVFPFSFDLCVVDGMNLISPVKDQSARGVCWAFGSMTASEANA